MNTCLTGRLLYLFLLAFPLVTLHAQGPTKIFVASTGNDASDGSRGSPKRTFQAAHDAVAAKGQIVVLDTAGYGPLTITKSLAVTVPPGVNGFVTVTGSADAITIATGSNDVVSLSGLIIEGGGTFNATGRGIHTTSVGTLTVENCTVRNFYRGLEIFATATAVVLIRDTVVRNVTYGCYLGVLSAGLASDATLTGCTVENAIYGVYVYVIGTAASNRVTVSRCVVSRCNFAVQTEGGASAQALLDDSTVTYASYCFFKQANQGTFFTRGNNTLAFVSNIINNNNAINTQPAF